MQINEDFDHSSKCLRHHGYHNNQHNRHTEGRTDTKTDDIQAGWQADILKTCVQADKLYKQARRQTDGQTDRRSDNAQRDGPKTDRGTERDRDR